MKAPFLQAEIRAIGVNVIAINCNSVPFIGFSIIMTLDFGVLFDIIFASNPSL